MIFNSPSIFSMPPPARDEGFNQDISLLENAFLRKDYGAIIESPELFWQAFCKAFSQIEGENSNFFSVSLQGKTLVISGKEHIIIKVKKFLEEIRKLFIKGHAEKRGFVMLSIKICEDYFIREKTDTIDLSNWTSDRHVKLTEYCFRDFVEPTMQSFCESIGAICSDVVVSQKILVYEFLSEDSDVKAFKIDWESGEHFIYPIEAKIIPSRDDFQKSMYSMYENQVLCDLSFIAKDGDVKVHSTPFFIYGGKVIQKMLTGKMKESLEKVVYFNEFSLNSVKAFIDFIYLGAKSLEPKSILKNGVDLCELLHMAHVYQVQTLIDCCTNLISLFSSTEDIEKIEHLAELYENEHLKELHRHLLLKLNPPQAGFIKI